MPAGEEDVTALGVLCLGTRGVGVLAHRAAQPASRGQALCSAGLVGTAFSAAGPRWWQPLTSHYPSSLILNLNTLSLTPVLLWSDVPPPGSGAPSRMMLV